MEFLVIICPACHVIKREGLNQTSWAQNILRVKVDYAIKYQGTNCNLDLKSFTLQKASQSSAQLILKR